ncbi:hypothetical protein [Mycolicibacterium sp. 120270]|uniref:hypothetical protein n=1 Tax=Mycolicibacterium sp. 120270 TaxID=3090600 RepID=UPI00299EF0D7|nr:hypothetical protein [Mycolicibacterium sp. 120270]MDX1885536.1 hypothetical protein [Mycolicibacterium sp. 120270]
MTLSHKVARMLTAGAPVLAPMGVAIYTASDALADHGDGGYTDSGSYDELINIVDSDGTQTDFDEDGDQAASVGGAGACWVPGGEC